VAPSREMQNNIIRQIVRRMTLHSSGLKSRMNLQLKPEFLGNVHMQITTEQQQVTVRMTAESIVVKELIEQQIQHLRSELQQHGLEIDKFEVFVGNGSENWKSSQENAAFRRALHRKGSGRTEQPGDDLGEDNDHASDGDKMPLRSRTREIDYFA
jgi:flagellar hook-length control protein FliK